MEPFVHFFWVFLSATIATMAASKSSHRPLRFHQHSAPCAHTTEDHRLGAVTLQKSPWKAGRRVDGLRGMRDELK